MFWLFILCASIAKNTSKDFSMSLKVRQSKEKRFQFAGLAAISISLLCLVMLFASVLSAGLPAFQQTFIKLTFNLPADKIDKSGNRNPQEIKKVSTIGYTKVITCLLYTSPSPRDRQKSRMPSSA